MEEPCYYLISLLLNQIICLHLTVVRDLSNEVIIEYIKHEQHGVGVYFSSLELYTAWTARNKRLEQLPGVQDIIGPITQEGNQNEQPEKYQNGL